jgi:hypothetical protein
VESAWVAIVVVVGSIMLLRGAVPGWVLAWYLVAYAAGRFCLEFLRGDPERPFACGVSVPQWVSLGLTGLVVAAERMGILPFAAWHLAAALLLLLAVTCLILFDRSSAGAKHRISQPRHVREIAQAIAPAALVRGVPAAEAVPVCRTSQGLLISGGRLHLPAGALDHYAISAAGNSMTEDVARAVGNIIARLQHPGAEPELKPGSRGIYHVLLPAGGPG